MAQVGEAYNCSSGNYRGVQERSWYINGDSVGGKWTYVFRFKDPEKAEKAADVMRESINNNNVYYVPGCAGTKDQLMSFTYALREVNWNPKKIKKKVYTACSQMVLSVVQATGIKNNKKNWPWADGPGTATKLKKLTSDFYAISNSKYTRSWKKLRRGDILVDSISPGHVAMVVE